jgi:hypothetical protein
MLAAPRIPAQGRDDDGGSEASAYFFRTASNV